MGVLDEDTDTDKKKSRLLIRVAPKGNCDCVDPDHEPRGRKRGWGLDSKDACPLQAAKTLSYYKDCEIDTND